MDDRQVDRMWATGESFANEYSAQYPWSSFTKNIEGLPRNADLAR